MRFRTSKAWYMFPLIVSGSVVGHPTVTPADVLEGDEVPMTTGDADRFVHVSLRTLNGHDVSSEGWTAEWLREVLEEVP